MPQNFHFASAHIRKFYLERGFRDDLVELMNKYSMTCSCGDVMSAEAENREDAVSKIKGTMTQEALSSHMAEKHPGEPVLTLEEVHAMIEKTTEMVV